MSEFARSDQSRSNTSRGDTSTENRLLPAAEVARQLHTEPYVLRQWTRKYARFLGDNTDGESPRFGSADVITLSIVQTLLTQGFTEEQIHQHLTLRQSAERAPEEEHAQVHDLTAMRGRDQVLAQSLNDVFGALADNQRTILSNQTTVREIVGVVVQDNFNLKEENRKLRKRMLALERALAEYQRREELRKERLESRLRALETTTGGLQQQIAQLVQIIRKKKRGLFW